MRSERLSEEEETYSTIFTALRHPIRRRILRMLANEPMAFTDILNQLGIESSHLTYHLDSLGVLLTKTEKGQYQLSTFGQAAVSMMGWVEEAPTIESKPVTLSTTWKAVFVLLVIGIAVFSGAYYSQYQVLSGLSMDYAELSDDFTQTKVEYTQIKTEYNETRLTYLELLGDYNWLLEQAKKSLSYDAPQHISVSPDHFLGSMKRYPPITSQSQI